MVHIKNTIKKPEQIGKEQVMLKYFQSMQHHVYWKKRTSLKSNLGQIVVYNNSGLVNGNCPNQNSLGREIKVLEIKKNKYHSKIIYDGCFHSDKDAFLFGFVMISQLM